MLRSKFGDHNSYASPDSINKIRWGNASLYPQVIDYYAGLIRLRKEHPAFRQTRKEDIEKTLELLSVGDSGVSFVLKENAASDSWRNIFVAYNGGLQPKTFNFPEGAAVWHQVVDSTRAGVEILGEFSGSITIPSLSMTVLYQ
jgi:pullulanase/glycogen debranching enzyme